MLNKNLTRLVQSLSVIYPLKKNDKRGSARRVPMRMQEYLEKASGGVLFEDEAYRLLVSDSDKYYGTEALETFM